MKTMANNLLNTLSMYKRNKEDLMTMYVSERLTKSFNTYDKELQQSIEFLTRKNEKSLLKRIKKIDEKHN